jgi:transposase-like protein
MPSRGAYTPRRPRGELRVHDEYLRAAELYAEGVSVADLATRYGVTRSTVNRWLVIVAESRSRAHEASAP